MKAIVMELRDKQMVVMKDDGTFLKLNRVFGAEVGGEVAITEKPSYIYRLQKGMAVAAAIMLVLLGGVETKAYFTPYGYMNIDINPSIQVGFNKFDRIISVNGINEDGQKVIAKTKDIKHSKIEDGVEKLVETAGNDSYLKNDTENDIMLSVYSPDSEKTKELNVKVNNSIKLYLNSHSKSAELINETVSESEIENAQQQGISVGKLKLYAKAKDAGLDMTIEQIKGMPVRDVVKAIKSAKKEDKKDNKAQVNKEAQTQTDDNRNTVDKKDKDSKKSENLKDKDTKKGNEQSKENKVTNTSENKEAASRTSINKIQQGLSVNDRIRQIEDRIKEITGRKR